MLGIVLLVVSCSCLMIDPQTYPYAIKLLQSSCEASNTTLTIPFNIPVDYLFWGNYSCNICNKRFKNQSYLTFHWVTKHYSNSSNLHLTLKHFCEFATCKGQAQLQTQSKMELCILFAEKYIEGVKELKDIDVLRRRDRFCRTVLSSQAEDHKDAVLEPFRKLGNFLLFVTLLIVLVKYYVGVYEMFVRRGKRRRKID